MNIGKIAVCGLGKLGAPIAAVFAASEVPVVGFDCDAEKVRLVKELRLPVNEPELHTYMALPEVKKNLTATGDVEEAVESSEACLFVTPTPSLSDGGFNHQFLLSAMITFAREVARQHRRRYLFVINSTIMPGTAAGEITPMLERFLGNDYELAYKPEFIALGTVIRDLHYPDVLLIGASSADACYHVEYLYREMLLGRPSVQHMGLTEAELAKISLNCAVTMKISFANQVGMIAERLGLNARKVLDAVGADPRVGSLCLRPGLPFGGPCFPRDNKMFQRVAALAGEQAPLAMATDLVNKRMYKRVLDRALETHGAVGILGLAYKPGTVIMEEAPGFLWRRALKNHGRHVIAHDPVAPHTHTIQEVLACPTVIVALPCQEYRALRLPASTLLLDPMHVVEEVVS